MAKSICQLEIDVAEVLDFLRMSGAFNPALSEVVKRRTTAEAAKNYGISVSTEELQKAADAFRDEHGLLKASDMRKWLKTNGLSIDAFERHLETDLLIGKFKDVLQAKANSRGAPFPPRPRPVHGRRAA